jgi:hypothetical protein
MTFLLDIRMVGGPFVLKYSLLFLEKFLCYFIFAMNIIIINPYLFSFPRHVCFFCLAMAKRHMTFVSTNVIVHEVASGCSDCMDRLRPHLRRHTLVGKGYASFGSRV